MECPVCMDPLGAGVAVLTCSSKHVVCTPCLVGLVQRGVDACPLCRAPIAAKSPPCSIQRVWGAIHTKSPVGAIAKVSRMPFYTLDGYRYDVVFRLEDDAILATPEYTKTSFITLKSPKKDRFYDDIGLFFATIERRCGVRLRVSRERGALRARTVHG